MSTLLKFKKHCCMVLKSSYIHDLTVLTPSVVLILA